MPRGRPEDYLLGMPSPGYGGGYEPSRGYGTLQSLLMERGRLQAEAAERSGALWANALGNLGQNISGAITQHQEAKKKKTRDDAYLAIMNDPKALEDPMYARQQFLKVGGPEDGSRMFQAYAGGLQLLQPNRDPEKDQKGAAAAIRGMRGMKPEKRAQAWQMLSAPAGKVFGGQLPQQYDDEFFNGVLVPWADSLDATPKTREIKTRNPDGSETVRIVDDKSGQEFTSAAEPPKKHMVTTTGPGGGPMQRLATETELAAGIPGYRAPSEPKNEPLEAVIGPDGNPVLVPRSQAAGKRPASSREQGRPVVSGDANRLADFDTSLDDLKTLKEQIGGATGVRAKMGAALPNVVTEMTGLGAEAKSKQAAIDRVKQVIGKALEGGVLRKEDETKYEKILPTIGDPPQVVEAKLKGLERAISERRQTLVDSLGDAGYDVTRYRSRSGAAPASLQSSEEALLKKYGY